MKSPKDYLILAMDTPSDTQVCEWILELKDSIGMFKVGLELFTSVGPKILKYMEELQLSVFLDLKLHDIPNTVAGAARNFSNYDNIKLLTVHSVGEGEMIKAALDAVGDKTDIIAVTLLTSLKTDNSLDEVKRRTELSLDAGAAGIVCSAYEVNDLRKTFGYDFKIVVPGVRLLTDNSQGGDFDDQKRTGHPTKIIRDGADYLVIGRPITEAESRIEAANEFLRIIKEEI